MAQVAMRYGMAGERAETVEAGETIIYGNMKVVYGNGGGNTSSAYNSSVLDVGEIGNPVYYVWAGGGGNTRTFSIQGSNNNSTWTTIDSVTSTANRITMINGNNNQYRYYRLHINAGTATATSGVRGMMACVDIENPS